MTQLVLGTERPDFSAVNLFSTFTILSNVAALTVPGAAALRPAVLDDAAGAPVRAAASAPGADPRP